MSAAPQFGKKEEVEQPHKKSCGKSVRRMAGNRFASSIDVIVSIQKVFSLAILGLRKTALARRGAEDSTAVRLGEHNNASVCFGVSPKS